MIIGSIRDNLLFGKKDATDDELYEALSMANALFAYDIDPHLDTFIGSASVLNLSGG